MPKSVDVILTNALVLTMDEKFTQYSPGAVVVHGNDIVAVGPADEISKEYASQGDSGLRRKNPDAGFGQRAYTRPDDTAARSGR